MLERRKYPRVTGKVPLKLSGIEDSDLITETINISCGGVYCKVSKFIPVMTKLKILMFVPPTERKKRSYRIECEGIVVRSEPESPSEGRKEYYIAIYFSRIKKGDRQKIAEYVKKRIRDNPCWN